MSRLNHSGARPALHHVRSPLVSSLFMNSPLALFSLRLSLCLSLALSLGCKEARRVSLTPGGEAGEATAGAAAGSIAGSDAGSDAGSTAGSPMGPIITESVKPHLKLKDHRTLSADLSATLELSPEELCDELGSFSCLENVHRVTLGGVAAERQNIYKPLKESAITAPAALDRVVYSACGVRVRRDFGPNRSSTSLFGALPLTARGELSDPESAEVRAALTTLINRALLREPRTSELESLIALYRDLEPTTQLPAASWAWGACFAVLTSVEFIFY